MRERRADAFHLVSGDRNADPRAAHNDTKRIFPRRNAFPHRARKVGIVHRFLRVSAYVIDSISRAFEIFLDIFLRPKSSMVSAQRNARLGGGFFHKRITAILSESAGEFQFQVIGMALV